MNGGIYVKSVVNMADNKKYAELIRAEKYDRYEKGEKMPTEKPTPPFQVVEIVNKPRIKGGYTALLSPGNEYLAFMLKLYQTQSLTGFRYLHGRKGDRAVKVVDVFENDTNKMLGGKVG
ncbi:MAG: hypothetical protein AEth_01788 [Candidatus Argoarchaeum ethanivorans]|uniref:Uncharacterized protein n=1 Tax=Candidatus Argoarchaeum ethanivorans TaxID=2608793 RepID=A0A8B3RYQ7_9EURY|nr:MAG: hypothetical protein AEth_01788 [Candidatus Argoarchaeum ethanivorans]